MRIAILGGSFDPIHNGHLTAARAVATAFRTDEVHFVPAYSAPHKQTSTTSPFHRFAMVALATMDFVDFRTSTVEMDAKERRYTVDSLELMNQLYPGAQLLFILGTDMFQEIESWKDYLRLFDLAHLAIVNRPGFPFREDIAPHFVVGRNEQIVLPPKCSVFYLPFVEQLISATKIRDNRKRGADVRQWLPLPVFDYIEKNKLYSRGDKELH